MSSARSGPLPVRTVVLNLPVYSTTRGLWRDMDDGHLAVELVGEDIGLRDDRQGLVWLATQLLALSKPDH